MDTLESLRRKIDGAEDLKSVVRSMKAMAASNIGQYEAAVDSLVIIIIQYLLDWWPVSWLRKSSP